jgi:hypothetical protein
MFLETPNPSLALYFALRTPKRSAEFFHPSRVATFGVETTIFTIYYSAHHGTQGNTQTILLHDVSSHVSCRQRCRAAADRNH